MVVWLEREEGGVAALALRTQEGDRSFCRLLNLLFPRFTTTSPSYHAVELQHYIEQAGFGLYTRWYRWRSVMEVLC